MNIAVSAKVQASRGKNLAGVMLEELPYLKELLARLLAVGKRFAAQGGQFSSHASLFLQLKGGVATISTRCSAEMNGQIR